MYNMRYTCGTALDAIVTYCIDKVLFLDCHLWVLLWALVTCVLCVPGQDVVDYTYRLQMMIHCPMFSLIDKSTVARLLRSAWSGHPSVDKSDSFVLGYIVSDCGESLRNAQAVSMQLPQEGVKWLVPAPTYEKMNTIGYWKQPLWKTSRRSRAFICREDSNS